MHAYDAGRWLALATLWSLQYIFMRVAVPVFGIAARGRGRARCSPRCSCCPGWCGSRASASACASTGATTLRSRWSNNVLPFVCFAWAATVLPAGYLAIINGMVPLWAALIAVPVLKEPLGAQRIAGFALGVAGVALIVNLGPVELDLRTPCSRALVGHRRRGVLGLGGRADQAALRRACRRWASPPARSPSPRC